MCWLKNKQTTLLLHFAPFSCKVDTESQSIVFNLCVVHSRDAVTPASPDYDLNCSLVHRNFININWCLYWN